MSKTGVQRNDPAGVTNELHALAKERHKGQRIRSVRVVATDAGQWCVEGLLADGTTCRLPLPKGPRLDVAAVTALLAKRY